jgi:hypothetical protein
MDNSKISEDIETLTLIGGIVTWWGRIENMLFSDLLTLQHHPAVKESGLCDTLQIATKRLITQWSQASVKATTSSEAVREISALVEQLRDTAADRHIVVHSFRDYPDTDDPTPTKVSVIKPQKGGGLVFAQYDLNPDKLHEIYSMCFSLYHRLLPVTLNHTFASSRWADSLKNDHFE